MKQMNWKRMTVYFIAVVILAIFVWDVLAIMNGGTEASISHVLILWSYQHPAFTFLMGFVMGHIFWRVRNLPSNEHLGKVPSGDISKD